MVVYFNQPIVIAPEIPEVSEPNVIFSEEEINQFIEENAYCEVDEDCTRFYAKCPFGCGRGINVWRVDSAQILIDEFIQHQIETNGIICEYGCVEVLGVSCQNHKCSVHTELSDREMLSENEE